MYSYKTIGNKHILSIDNHCEIVEAIKNFCKEKGILSGSISGIGAVNEMTLRFFNPTTKHWEDKSFCEQMEIANLTGNISSMDGEPYLHLHITVGRSDYSSLAGHLLSARLNGAGEIIIEDFKALGVGRMFNPDLGLNCYDFSQRGDLSDIRFVAFDADDTLWETELYFREFECKVCEYMKKANPSEDGIDEKLFAIETGNIEFYGYGLKSMMLSMIETACELSSITGSNVTDTAKEVIGIGRDLMTKPVEILPGVKDTLSALKGHYSLLLATKGDLVDQKRKIESSGLEEYFDYIEIMSDKKPADYRKMLSRIGCPAENFLMVGNSVKSDILPVLEIGGRAAHVPHAITWAHEEYDGEIHNPRFVEFKNITEIINYLLKK